MKGNGRQVLRSIFILVIAQLIIWANTGFAYTSADSQYVRDSIFTHNYTLSGNGAEDICRVAEAQYNAGLGSILESSYKDAWCAAFVSDCAILAGQASAVPHTWGADVMSKNLWSKRVYSPQRGDIFVIDCATCLNNGTHYRTHTGLMTSATDVIHGNYGNTLQVGTISTVVSRWSSTCSNCGSKNWTATYFRPDYTGSSPISPDVDEYYKVIDSTGLNLRATPNGTLIVNVPQNEVVHVTQKQYNSASGYDWGYTTYNGQSGWLCIGNPAWATQITDSEAPTVTSINVVDVDSSGYTVNCTFSDNIGVTRVAFPTIANGETEFLWRDGTVSGNSASFRVSISDHGNRSCDYRTEVYAFDAAGNVNAYNDSIIRSVFVPPQPGKPSVSASASDDLHEVILSWNATSDTTWYDIRVFHNGEDSEFWGRGGYDKTDISLLLPAGSYQANVASVFSGNGMGTWTFSDKISFTVGTGSLSGRGTPVASRIYDKKLYQVYQKSCTWLEAKKLCEKYVGHLATVSDPAENEVVAGLAQDTGMELWIGAESYSNNSNFTWVDGTTWSYTNWNTGEPNNDSGVENCLHLLSTGFWNDAANSSQNPRGYIIEAAPTKVVVDMETRYWPDGIDTLRDDLTVYVHFNTGIAYEVDDYDLTVDGVSGDTVQFTVSYGGKSQSASFRTDAFSPFSIAETTVVNGMTYTLYTGTATWSEAQRFAESLGGDLMTIDSTSKQSIVETLIDGHGDKNWIGAYKDTAGMWRWASGKSFSYSNWASEQPDGTLGIQYRGAIYADGTWDDDSNSGFTFDVTGFLVEVPVTFDIVLPEALTVIDIEAFAGSAVTSVKCPEGLEEIDARAFADCTALKMIYIPTSCTYISASAFSGCSSDMTIYAPDGSVAKAYANSKGYAFVACDGILE